MVFTVASMLVLRLLAPILFATPTPPVAVRAPLDTPPAPLACLVKYYGVTAERDQAGWWARVDATTRIPWDDGLVKGAEERLADPDLEDAFAQPYTPGPIVRATTPDDDPGRVRLDPVLRAAYPRNAVSRVDFAGKSVRFASRAAPALTRVAARLGRALAADSSLRPFVAKLGGTLNERVIAGTDRPSAHSWGIAIDLDPNRADYWRWTKDGRWRHPIPQAIVDAFEAEGFIWGGRWYHFDTMHFEYRPELLDRACRQPVSH
jgi:D-alanyl-D-alanine carboxypeptidase-like protein